MTGPALDPDFPVARCAVCKRVVLTHVHLDDRGEPRRRCLHCDADVDHEAVRWVTPDELVPLGYAFDGEEAAGCGRPGCGRGNCANRR